MIDFEFNSFCSGCGACCNVCPINAITMVPNAEGFLLPKIDKNICINCGKCEAVCPHLNKEQVHPAKADVKAVWLYASPDDEVKYRSSSGAACFEFGKTILKTGGFVAGCIWDKDLVARHAVGKTEDLLIKTQSSKYVQSDTGNVYKAVLELLKKGNTVLFTGTPCQATAMHNIVMNFGNKKFRKNLITVGVLCHGVASPMVWESFKKFAAKQEGSPLVKVNFRDKSKEGYKKSYCHYEYANGRSTYLPTFLPSSKYIEATLVYNLAIRNSCSHCDCKGINTGIDLIVGDWYAEYQGEGKLGTSCIIAFTEHGKTFAESTLVGLRVFNYESIVRDNSFIEKSINKSPNREKFFERIGDCNYWSHVEELYPPKYKYKKLLVKLGIFEFLKRIIG